MYQIEISGKVLAAWLTTGARVEYEIAEGLPPNVKLIGGLFMPDGDEDGRVILYFDDPENPEATAQTVDVRATTIRKESKDE